ncbi:serine/threonine-protein kinase [Streptosporangium sp. NPDC048047]|uniref:serine/threonine-protein kinase n=1 Tax=Streptosporangium sp. NPDC048047 TaxID=3155748 RepID=UPI003420AF11
MEPAGWAVRVPTGYTLGVWKVCSGIATGGWSSVYEARRTAQGRDDVPDRVALKFIPTGTLNRRQLGHLADMAHREMRLYERLEHPRLIRLFDTLTVDDPAHPELDGAAVLVMELASGSLADLRREHDAGPVPDAPRLLAEVCEGIAHLHAEGWVHGDLKPSNILIMADGSVRLADFGLAAELEGTHGYLPPLGSSDYVPPERWTEPLGQRGMPVRTTADIWAFGVIAHQMLTGSFPFAGTTARGRAAAAAEYAGGKATPALDPSLPAGWREVIADCLTPRHADRREHSAERLLARVRELAADRPAAASRTPAPSRPRALARLVVPVVAAGIVLLPAHGDGAGIPRRERQAFTHQGERPASAYSKWFRTDADIPRRYYDLIVQAGTMCHEAGVYPASVAAILKAESGFDVRLSDPVKNEYGIARWSPEVLQLYLPPGRRSVVPKPPFTPEDSIPALGRYLCRFAPALEAVPGDPALNLAASYRTADYVVRQENGIPARLRPYTERVLRALSRYRPAAPSPVASAGERPTD